MVRGPPVVLDLPRHNPGHTVVLAAGHIGLRHLDSGDTGRPVRGISRWRDPPPGRRRNVPPRTQDEHVAGWFSAPEASSSASRRGFLRRQQDARRSRTLLSTALPSPRNRWAEEPRAPVASAKTASAGRCSIRVQGRSAQPDALMRPPRPRTTSQTREHASHRSPDPHLSEGGNLSAMAVTCLARATPGQGTGSPTSTRRAVMPVQVFPCPANDEDPHPACISQLIYAPFTCGMNGRPPGSPIRQIRSRRTSVGRRVGHRGWRRPDFLAPRGQPSRRTRIQALVKAGRAGRAGVLLDRGGEGLLTGLGPTMRWRPRILEIDHEVPLDGRDLVFVGRPRAPTGTAPWRVFSVPPGRPLRACRGRLHHRRTGPAPRPASPHPRPANTPARPWRAPPESAPSAAQSPVRAGRTHRAWHKPLK
ncbi:hypothetical protein RKD23_007795 [Streptomyces sp. SAI-170]